MWSSWVCLMCSVSCNPKVYSLSFSEIKEIVFADGKKSELCKVGGVLWFSSKQGKMYGSESLKMW